MARSVLRLATTFLAATLAACGGSTSDAPTGAAPRHVAVADTSNHRALVYTAPFSNGMSAAVVLGQAGFTTRAAAVSASALTTPTAVAVDGSKRLYVADRGNNRIVRFSPPLTDGMAADLVLGQTGFDATIVGSGAAGLNFPASVAVDGSGSVWVGDSVNHRVLRFVPPLASGMQASLVIGQADFTGTLANRGGAVAANTLENMRHLAFDDAGNLWVADTFNNRVLKFAAPFSNGMAASVALGQASLAANVTAGTPTAATLNTPCGLAFDATGHLWVADSASNRIVRYTPPFTTGMAADLVLGQASFTTNAAATTQAGLAFPIGVSVDPDGRLWTTESSNNRTVVFTPPFSSGMNASVVLGQPNFTTATVLDPPTAASENRLFGVVAY